MTAMTDDNDNLVRIDEYMVVNRALEGLETTIRLSHLTNEQKAALNADIASMYNKLTKMQKGN